MENFKINQIDYRYLLVDTYKSLGLSEVDLALLLVVDNVLKEAPTLITAEILALKMNLDVKDIDKMLVSLMNRGFLEFTNFGNKNNLTTSIQPTYKRLSDNFIKEVITSSSLEDNKERQEIVSNIFSLFSKELGRALTPIELEKIREWVAEGIKENIIIDSLHECQARSKRVTIRQIDKIIIKRMTSNDVQKEGYSAISEKYRQELETAIDIADTKWTDD